MPAAQAVVGFHSSASDDLTVTSGLLATPAGAGAAVDSCTPGGSVAVRVTWTASADTVTNGYTVFRSDGGGPASAVGTVAGGGTTAFDDPAVPFSTSVAYTVEGTRGGWTSLPSSAASLTTPDATCA